MKNTAKIATVSGLNIHNLSAEEFGEAMDWREEVSPGCLKPMGETFSRKGLQKMVDEAVEMFVFNANNNFGKKGDDWNFNLPWNLASAGPWWSLPYHQNFAINGGIREWIETYHSDNEHLQKFAGKFETRCPDGPVEYAARFSGWLKVAGKKRGLVKVLMATTTPNGMWSPYTVVNPFHLFERFPSPHRAERQIWKVRRRANQILRPYGISVSWESLGEVLVNGPKAVGKAAIKAASETLKKYLWYYDNHEYDLPFGRYDILRMSCGLTELKSHPEYVQRWAVGAVFFGQFETIREALKSADCLMLDETDGVRLYVDPETEEIIHGVSCIRGWTAEKPKGFGDNGQVLLLRQEKTGRSYHYTFWGDMVPRRAVKYAIGEWHKQIKAERKNRKIFRVLQPKNASILVWFQDSLDSGNCSPGTRAWAESHGFNGDMFCPAEKLLKFADDPRVFRVLQMAAEKVAKLKLAV